MSHITRTIRNAWKAGFRRAANDLYHLNDTKAGVLVGTDR